MSEVENVEQEVKDEVEDVDGDAADEIAEALEGEEAAEDTEEAAEAAEEAAEDAEAPVVEEKDVKHKKQHVWFLPAVNEFKQDMLRYQLSRSIMVGPVTLKDLQARNIVPFLQLAKTFGLGYQKNEAGNEFTGYIQMVFGTEEEAVSACEQLNEFRAGVTAKHCAQSATDKGNVDYAVLNEFRTLAGEPHWKHETTVTVTDLAEDVTGDMVWEQFPEAKLVYLPKEWQPEPEAEEDEVDVKEEEDMEAENGEATEEEKKEKEKKAAAKKKEEEKKAAEKKKKEEEAKEMAKKRYAYVIFNTEEEAKEWLHKSVTINEVEYTVWELPYYRVCDQLVRQIDSEKLFNNRGPPPTINAARRKKLLQYQHEAQRFLRTDYLQDYRIDKLKQRLDTLNKVLDAKGGSNGGERGGASGGRGQKRRGGPGGDGPPQKRGRGGPHRGGAYGGGPPMYGGYDYGYDAWGYGGGYGMAGGYGGGYGGRGPMRGGRGRGGRW